MLHVDGYTIWECLQTTRYSAVYSGIRTEDRRRVVLKYYRRGRSKDRAEREYEILRRIDSDQVIRPVDLCTSAKGPVLVVDRFAGYPLSRHPKGDALPTESFLRVALGVTRALAAVHDARVIHKDVKLSNILVDPERSQTCLIDFGISTEFGRAEESHPPETAEGTMLYIAPEQTGRMGAGVDFRSDLYSLGASLYELLTNRPPFREKKGLDLIHAHIALRPKPPIELRPGVSPTLSRIVEKLLEKDPELRYQTARGLAADLETCRKQLELSGEIDPELELGTADASDRLRFPSKLYGREIEVSALRRALARISQRRIEWVLLAGPAGIGKSSLPGTLREPLTQASGYLAETKFDADRRDRPYAGFATLLSSLIAQILSERCERLDYWRDKVRAQVGAVGDALYDLAPNLRYLIDDFPPAPALDAKQEQERLALAVTRLVSAFARVAHPLVLFLDDLQWADAGSLALLSGLLSSSEAEALLVIGGYRDNEVDADHPLSAMLRGHEARGIRPERLTLRPLDLEHTTEMLADVLGRSRTDAEWLARRVGPKSQHNPLLLRRLMFHLWDRDLLRYEHGSGWVWDEARLTEAEITDDIAAMVASRIGSLSARAANLLEIASLIGNVFDLELLVAISGTDRLDALQDLMGLVDQGLLTPCNDGFKFVHDRIREAAQARVGPDERAALHHRAARELLDRTPAKELPSAAFRIADHLLAATALLDEGERVRTIELLALAGKTALRRGAAEASAHYLEAGRAMLAPADWTERGALAFQLWKNAAEAAFQLRRFEHMRWLLDQLEPHPLDRLQRAIICAQRISLVSFVDPESATELALSALGEFGLRIPRRPSWLHLRMATARTDWMLRKKSPRTDAPISPEIAPQLLLLHAALTRLVLDSGDLGCLGSALLLRLARRKISLEKQGRAIASYAGLRLVSRGGASETERLAALASHYLESEPGSLDAVRGQLSLHVLIYSWLRPRRAAVEALARTADLARELGDLECVLLATHASVAYGALSGQPLYVVEQRLAELLAVRRSGSRPSRQESLMANGYALLQSDSGEIEWDEVRSWPSSLVSLLGDESPARYLYGGCHISAALALLGHFDRATAMIEQHWRDLPNGGAMGSRLADFVFYRGLAHAGQTSKSLRTRSHLRIVRSSVRRLRAWARLGPDFAHMATFLEAELARIRGRSASALRLYQSAGRAAQRIGYVQHAALALERRARLLASQRRETEAGREWASATELYREWGATAKVAQLTAGDPGAP